DVAEDESFREGVGGIDEVCGEAVDPGLAGDSGNDGGILADCGFFDEPAGEGGAHDAFVDEIPTERKLVLRVHDGHAGAGAGAAGGAVEHSSPGGGVVAIERAG